MSEYGYNPSEGRSYKLEVCTRADDDEDIWEHLGWFKELDYAKAYARKHRIMNPDRPETEPHIEIADAHGGLGFEEGSYAIYGPIFWEAQQGRQYD